MPWSRVSLAAAAIATLAASFGNASVVRAQTPDTPTPAVAGTPAPASQADAPRGKPRVTWAVNERVRYSGLLNQFRPGLAGDDRALVFRTTLKADLAWPRVTISAELQDARAYFTDAQSNVSTTLVNPIDLLQAYVHVRRRPGDTAVVPEAHIGRFTMELGSGRVVAQEAYRDVTRTFTGAKARWPRVGRGALTTFAVLPVASRPDDRDGLLHNRLARDTEHLNQKFWGALYERDRLWRGTRLDGYLYGLGEHDDPGRRDTRDRRLWTAGLRLHRPAALGAWDVDAESAWQRGRAHATTAPADRRALTVAARLLHVHAGYTAAARWSPRLGVEYDYGTGDADPGDGEWNRFDGLFGHRRQELGPTSIYGALGRENIDTVGLRAAIVPDTRTDVFAAYRVVRLAAAADAFASTGVRDATGGAGRDGGQQVDVRLRRWLKPGLLRLEVGATHLIAGRFLRTAPNATRGGNTTFFYGDLTYSFTSATSGSGNRSR